MTVPAVSGASEFYRNVGATTDTTAAEAASGQQSLGKDSFLELLVASLKYQDPSSPMDTSELMAQTTQLSTMEQLVGLTEMAQQSFALQQRSSASALVGQYVTYYDGDGKPVTGLVKSVDLTTETPLVVIGDVAVPLPYIAGVAAPPVGDAAQPANSNSDADNDAAAANAVTRTSEPSSPTPSGDEQTA
ncbi:flagellar hook capping FlgD N-terminal domain-containing protein [Georgenia yuyongxinii]|uniref:Flagellar hook capping protein n=1 Tax=Georgenia yuyongxinii TaxID=2589797 RepID=A0A552WSP9_9MICO|nr:flagellar hook capping FlgD N-terminal domain-containing protein [Georgenia yuyongxinii]TRW45629.1 flagellar hook capping protein [Georgenia yuyongxinii]